MSEEELKSIGEYRVSSVKVVKDMQEVIKLFLVNGQKTSYDRFRTLLKVYIEIQQAYLNNLSGKVSNLSREIESSHYKYASRSLEPETGDGG